MTQFHSFAIDDFVLTGEDAHGCLWTVEKPSGWYTGGEVRTSTTPRAQQNGDWRGRAYKAGRQITLRGKVFADGPTSLELAGRRLSALLASGGFGTLSGSSDAGTYTAKVQLDDTPLFDTTAGKYATWQVTVGSEDPLLYGPEVFSQASATPTGGSGGRVWPRVWPTDWGIAPGVTPGAVTLDNAGTASYFPRIRLENRWVNPVLTVPETGDWLRIGRTIEAGQHVDINWGTPRRVTVGDNPISIRHQVTYSGNFLAIPAGGASLVVSSDDASTDAVMSVWSYEGAYE